MAFNFDSENENLDQLTKGNQIYVEREIDLNKIKHIFHSVVTPETIRFVSGLTSLLEQVAKTATDMVKEHTEISLTYKTITDSWFSLMLFNKRFGNCITVFDVNLKANDNTYEICHKLFFYILAFVMFYKYGLSLREIEEICEKDSEIGLKKLNMYNGKGMRAMDQLIYCAKTIADTSAFVETYEKNWVI